MSTIGDAGSLRSVIEDVDVRNGVGSQLSMNWSKGEEVCQAERRPVSQGAASRLDRCQAPRTRLIIFTKLASGWAPTVLSTGWSVPPLKSMTCGIDEMP